MALDYNSAKIINQARMKFLICTIDGHFSQSNDFVSVDQHALCNPWNTIKDQLNMI